MTSAATDIQQTAINTIRTLAIDAVQKVGNGHPGAPMGMATMAYVLWTRHLRHNPRNPEWPDRDRFVLSAGHASMLQYSLLHLTGYDLSLDDIMQLRTWESLTPGHPERGVTPGVEVSTGPLGQGFAMGVGMAVAERILADRFGSDLVDHWTYAIVSDGDLMEGVAAEAASTAGALGLGRLIYLWDDNEITIDGPASISRKEDVAARFAAYGWHVQQVDGNDIEALDAALAAAKAETARPSLIAARTTIGHGSPNKAGKSAAHGAALGPDEVKLTKQALGWPEDAQFLVPDEVRTHFQATIDRGQALEAEWNTRLERVRGENPTLAAEWDTTIGGGTPDGWVDALPVYEEGQTLATRQASGQVLNAIAPAFSTLVGGSADLAESTNTELKGLGDAGNGDWSGRNIRFGIREHAMGALCNGMALHGGVRPFGGTFLVFSDYLRPALRLSAIQQADVTWVFTHDSIGVGEDGPTHQPVEHIASMRAMPELVVCRPADANETALCWRIAIETDGPVALVLSRQGLPVLGALDRMNEGVARGAYVLRDSPTGRDDLALIATGSEVSLTVKAQEALAAERIGARVVSMPSWELFARQDDAYRDAVLPASVPVRVAVEAGATFGWERWTHDPRNVVGIDRFGASAAGARVMQELGMTVEHVVEVAKAALERRS